MLGQVQKHYLILASIPVSLLNTYPPEITNVLPSIFIFVVVPVLGGSEDVLSRNNKVNPGWFHPKTQQRSRGSLALIQDGAFPKAGKRRTLYPNSDLIRQGTTTPSRSLQNIKAVKDNKQAIDLSQDGNILCAGVRRQHHGAPKKNIRCQR
jgi:hypothetical protein